MGLKLRTYSNSEADSKIMFSELYPHLWRKVLHRLSCLFGYQVAFSSHNATGIQQVRVNHKRTSKNKPEPQGLSTFMLRDTALLPAV